jgi:hypothetical protein
MKQIMATAMEAEDIQPYEPVLVSLAQMTDRSSNACLVSSRPSTRSHRQLFDRGTFYLLYCTPPHSILYCILRAPRIDREDPMFALGARRVSTVHTRSGILTCTRFWHFNIHKVWHFNIHKVHIQ